MRIQLLTTLSAILISSCKPYLDVTSNEITTDYMTFKFQKKHNELNYFSKVNSSADKEVFYTTHFSIKLPKNIVYWNQLGNKFYFEYDSKQVIYIYTSYKNEGKESSIWELKNINKERAAKYLEDYWKSRDYNEKLLSVEKNNSITKIYTNGKYEILLYNIKEKNFTSFFELVKTFSVKS